MKRLLYIGMSCALAVAAFVGVLTVCGAEKVDAATPDSGLAGYWDGVATLSDTAGLSARFERFVGLLQAAEPEARKSAVADLVSRSAKEPDGLLNVIDVAEKVLYLPGAVAYDEDLYAEFLNTIMLSPDIIPTLKIRPAAQLEEIMKNRPGDTATDFAFETPDGTKAMLSTVCPGKDVLLIFYDPDCEHCGETIRTLRNDTRVARKIADGTLGVVAVYSGDERDFWLERTNAMPDGWTIGYDDGGLQDYGLYILRSMPTLYLLDKDRKVRLKEPSLEELLSALQ